MGRSRGGSAVIARKLGACRELEDRDGHAIAGFLEAEGSFSIGENNSGQSWSCAFSLAQRDDETPVLQRLQRLTGIGALSPRRARRGSKPQTTWSLSAQLECLRLIAILERFPMHGRKRHEVPVWAEAVRAWSQGADAEIMGRHAREIRDLRSYVDPGPPSRLPGEDAEGLLWYLGGFFSGEGFFQLSPTSARIGVKLRRDDRPLLDRFATVTGLGRVYDIPATRTSGPAAAWVILAQRDFEPAFELFESAPLWGRKRREFIVWRAGAQEFLRARRGTRKRDPEIMAAGIDGLQRVRAYKGPRAGPDSAAANDARSIFLEILREWASSTEGPLSVTRYHEARKRRSDWPDRNTVARTFGSWSAALQAAGLAHRAALPPHVAAARARGARRRVRKPAAVLAKGRSRAVVASSVAQLTRSLGRLPRATEYFRWRLDEAPTTPSQATTYKLFGGNWDTVLAAAGWYLLPEPAPMR